MWGARNGCLILSWHLLGTIDFQRFDRSFLRLEFQSELFLHRFEEGWPHAFDRFVQDRLPARLEPVQRNLEITIEPGLIDDWPIHLPRKRGGKLGHRGLSTETKAPRSSTQRESAARIDGAHFCCTLGNHQRVNRNFPVPAVYLQTESRREQLAKHQQRIGALRAMRQGCGDVVSLGIDPIRASDLVFPYSVSRRNHHRQRGMVEGDPPSLDLHPHLVCPIVDTNTGRNRSWFDRRNFKFSRQGRLAKTRTRPSGGQYHRCKCSHCSRAP